MVDLKEKYKFDLGVKGLMDKIVIYCILFNKLYTFHGVIGHWIWSLRVQTPGFMSSYKINFLFFEHNGRVNPLTCRSD